MAFMIRTTLQMPTSAFKKFFAGLCFFSRDAMATNKAIKIDTGIIINSKVKLNVQKSTKNSNATMAFKLSSMSFLKNRASLAFLLFLQTAAFQ